MSQLEFQTEAREERDAAIRRAVADYVREVVLGRVVSPEAWAETHADLLPELAFELKKVQLIGIAYQHALAHPSHGEENPSEQPTQSYWRADISTLHVRCPHCHNPVDISCDESLVDILCSTCGSSFSLLCDTQATPTVKKIGHFELIERLGTGGFGSVWKARDTELDRTVAIKIPRAGRLDSADVEMSFFREARAAAQLKHPGIVSVHEVGRQDDIIYIVSDLVRGVSLSEWLTAAQPTAREAAEVCAKIADALHHAHEAGVVHRDLKPSNIMMDLEGAPHIMDFGLARRDVGEITVTIDGQTLGTPAYMSPEHARGEAHQADRRSDVYSLGVILFQLLTGELPFRGHARMIMMQILRDEPPKPRTLKASIPRDLQTICLKCLEKEPSRRYATAADLAEDLRRFLRNEPIRAQPITHFGRFYRWCKRQPAIAALSGTLALALAAAIVAGFWYAAIRGADLRTNLYHRMVRQVQVARLQSAEGYFSRAWEELKVARWTDTPDVNLDMLRQEAVLCLGDFRGYEPTTIESVDRSITVCSFQPDGNLLAIGHLDGHVDLHDRESGGFVAKIAGKGNAVAALSFTGDGQRLFCADSLGHVRESTVVTTRSPLEPIAAVDLFNVDGGYKSHEFVPGGQYLVSHNETSASVWDTTTRRRILAVGPLEDRELTCVRMSPDEKWLAASAKTAQSASDRLLLWDVETGELKNDIALDRGHGYSKSLAFSNDSSLIAFGGEGLAVYRVPTLAPYFFYAGDAVLALAFSPDDQYLSLVQIRGTVAIWNMGTNTKIASLAHPRAPNATYRDESAVFSSDGRFLASARAYSVRTWNLYGIGEQLLAGHSGGVPTLMFTNDGKRLVSGGKDQSVRIWDLALGKQDRAPLLLDGPVQCLGLSPDNRWLATADWSAGDASPTLHVASLVDFSKKSAIPHKLGSGKGHLINGVAFSPNGKYLAVCGNGMQLWSVNETDVATGALRLSEITHQSGGRSRFLRFSPDSRLLVWADDQVVRIWDIGAGQKTSFKADVHFGWHGFAFVNGGLAFVVPGLSVGVWDVREGVKQFSLGEAGEFQTPHIAASPDLNYLVGLHRSDTLALWDVRAQKRLFVFRPQRSEIWSLAFDPTGTKLGIGLSDGGVSVWDLGGINQALAELDLDWQNSAE